MQVRALCLPLHRRGASESDLNPMVVKSVWLEASLRTPDTVSPSESNAIS
jgi:hypothetical protein